MKDRLYFQWHITDACNWRCKHCYQDNFTAENDLKLDELIMLWENISNYAEDKNFKVNIAITGGEPFLRKDIFMLLEYLDNQKYLENLFIITNGSFISKDTLEKIKKIKKIKQIRVSLDGANLITNDKIRNKGSFNMVLEKIKLIKQNKLEVFIMFTLMKSNLEELNSLFELAIAFRVDGIILEKFIPLGQSKNLISEVISREDWYYILKKTFYYFGYSILDEKIFPIRALLVKFKNLETKILIAYCNLGKDSFAILPNADLLPCRRFNLVIGNLMKQNFFEIIQEYDKLFSQITNKNNLKGRCKRCIYNCFGCRAIGYAIYNDYLAEDFQCNRRC